MPKKAKKVKSDCNRTRGKTSCIKLKKSIEDCIFIGKENMKKWREIKCRFNFITDQEFTSYLLNFFSNEKSFALIKSFEKEIENKPPNYLASDEVIYSDHDVPNSIKHKIEDAKMADNSSSVIVLNKAAVNVDIAQDISKSNVGSNPEIKGCENNFSEPSNNKDLIHQVKKTNLVEIDMSVKSLGNCESGSGLNDTASPSATQKKQKRKKINSKCKDRLPIDEERKICQKKKTTRNPETSNDAVMGENKESATSTKMECTLPVIATVNHVAQAVVSEPAAATVRLCCNCELHHHQDSCPLRNPVRVIPDAVWLKEWAKVEAREGLSFAEASLPPCFRLSVVDSKHGPSVVARQAVEGFVQFGPLVGRAITEREIPDDSTMEHIWEINDAAGSHYLTTSDENDSNWLRYVRPAAERSSRNVEVLLCNSQLFFVTTSAIAEGEELRFWAENTNTAWSQKKLNRTKCGGCNLSFSHTLYYRLHCTVFHDPSYSLTVRKYHCKVCGCSVLGKENIVKHAAEKHNGKGAYQCQFCNKFFLRLNYLEMHRTYGCSANPNRSRPLCDYCGRKFCQPQKLKVHIKRMHSEMLDVLRDFQCKHCHKILGSRAALQRHFKEVHQKDVVGACTCDRCGKMFQNKSNLKIHMLTHSGIKPFKCRETDCPAAFTTKQCLQFHYRKVHGLAEGSMPQIQRSVEYTFDAYAGSRRPDSCNSDSLSSSDGEENRDKCHSEETPLSPPISVTGDASSQPALDNLSNMVASKGSKKWIGDSSDTASKTVFDFDEDDKEQDINVSHIDEEPIPMLFHNCKQDSANASLLVEAALDAAEKDIDPSKLSPMSLVTNKESYLRSHIHSPLGLSRPASPMEYPMQDQSQSPHLMESCYTTMSPRHPYSLMFPERTPHYDFRLSSPGQMDSFHLEDLRYDHHRREENSSDEGVNLVQNLSLLKKPMLDMAYKYDTLEDRSFEGVEGLDMSRTSGYHHSFVSVAPRYPLYEPRSYSHTDVLRAVNFSHSVDLSLPRGHHQLTPPMNQSLIEPIRIISPPPPPYQAYPLTSSPPPYSRPSHSPSYHHYNSSY